MKTISRVPCLILALVVVMNVAFMRGRASDDTAQKLDEFSGTNWEDAMAHLDNFALKLQTDASAIGVMVVYGGQHRRRFEPDAWAKCLQDYLVNRRGIDATRLIVTQGGYRENVMTELWEAPDKNHLPKVKSTIKPSDVKFTGADVTRWQAFCGS
jgi:hypothetical protein